MSARSIVLRVVLLAALFAGVVLLLGGLVPGARGKVADADPAWIAAAVVLELVACGGYVLLWHAVFARLPLVIRGWRSTQIALAELGGFAIIPAGVGGPAERIWGLRRAGLSWRMLGVRTVSHAAIFNAPYIGAAFVLGIGVLVDAAPATPRIRSATSTTPVGASATSVEASPGAASTSTPIPSTKAAPM